MSTAAEKKEEKKEASSAPAPAVDKEPPNILGVIAHLAAVITTLTSLFLLTMLIYMIVCYALYEPPEQELVNPICGLPGETAENKAFQYPWLVLMTHEKSPRIHQVYAGSLLTCSWVLTDIMAARGIVVIEEYVVHFAMDNDLQKKIITIVTSGQYKVALNATPMALVQIEPVELAKDVIRPICFPIQRPKRIKTKQYLRSIIWLEKFTQGSNVNNQSFGVFMNVPPNEECMKTLHLCTENYNCLEKPENVSGVVYKGAPVMNFGPGRKYFIAGLVAVKDWDLCGIPFVEMSPLHRAIVRIVTGRNLPLIDPKQEEDE